MQKIIEEKIYELLLTEDFVVLPNLGGFVVNYQSAYFDKQKNIYYPPKREIGFNRRLQHDDGLLISAISESENKTYAEGKTFVAEYVADLHDKLNKGQTVTLDKIGRFEKNTELRFYPESTNFLLDAFGLESIYVPKAKPLPKEPAKIEIPTLQKHNYKKWLAAASLALSMALIPHNILQKGFTNTSESNILDLTTITHQNNFFSDPVSQLISDELDAMVQKKVALLPTIKQDKVKKEETSQSKTIEKEVVEQPTAITKQENDSKAVQPKEVFDKSPKEEIVEKKSSKINNRIVEAVPGYYLVVGSFKDEKNANKFLDKIRHSYSEAIMINYKGFYRISISIFDSKNEAKKKRKQLKSAGVSNWLMRI